MFRAFPMTLLNICTIFLKHFFCHRDVPNTSIPPLVVFFAIFFSKGEGSGHTYDNNESYHVQT